MAEPQEESPETRLQNAFTRADAMFDNQEIEELLALLREITTPQPNDEVLWRLARALNEQSKRVDDKAEKKKLIFEAHDSVKQALALNDKNFACHKWYAILMDKVAEYEGTKARISQAYVVKEHFVKASELNPKDATTLYSLGVWCFLFADMPWYQRKIAGALFASPPTSTYDEALQYFQKAEETEPGFFSKNLMMLGKTYSRMGDKKMAMVYLTRAMERPIKTPDDKEAHKEAGDLLSKMGVKLDK
ncbi:regulator of microtubule dynamics protein 1-like isoform X2 [Babylonia areolata]